VADLDRLETIAQRGGPAHAREARRLLERAQDGADVTEAADLLWDAYLHDPYLERG
jgi:hypothetical protein